MRADLNCIQERLIPTKYYHKTNERLSSANVRKINIRYKLSKVNICQDRVCFKTSFVLVKNITDKVILKIQFIYLLYPFTTDINGVTTKPFGQRVTFKFLTKLETIELKGLKEYSISINILNQKVKQIKFLKDEIKYKIIEDQLINKTLNQIIEYFKTKLAKEICASP